FSVRRPLVARLQVLGSAGQGTAGPPASPSQPTGIRPAQGACDIVSSTPTRRGPPRGGGSAPTSRGAAGTGGEAPQLALSEGFGRVDRRCARTERHVRPAGRELDLRVGRHREARKWGSGRHDDAVVLEGRSVLQRLQAWRCRGATSAEAEGAVGVVAIMVPD